MVYTSSTTSLKSVTIKYLYWEYERDEEIYDINLEELEETHTLNLTDYGLYV
jgi:hypothetical protein